MRTVVLKINARKPQASKIRYAAGVIRRGNLVAFPTETVYGLGADALDAKAVRKIFVAKGRPADNPLIVHVYDKEDVKDLASDIPHVAEKLISRFWPGPLTIVLKKSKIVPKITTGGLDTVAIRMPKNKIARMLILEAGTPIAAPSANFFGRPSPTLAKHVLEDLDGRISAIIDGGQTRIGIESTVVDVTGKIPMLLRPGSVTLEELRDAVGRVDVHPVLSGKKSGSVHRSPGMKYKHYSPDAQVILIEGKSSLVHVRILRMVQQLNRQGKLVGVITTRNDKYTKNTRRVGTGSKFAVSLFKIFREFDSKKVDVILVQGIPRKGIGLGIMNRLGKAAYRKIRA